VEQPMTQYYDPDSPVNLRRSIASTERKLKELHLRKEIAAINTKLKTLKDIQTLYSTQSEEGKT
jgi:hypothetical protein